MDEREVKKAGLQVLRVQEVRHSALGACLLAALLSSGACAEKQSWIQIPAGSGSILSAVCNDSTLVISSLTADALKAKGQNGALVKLSCRNGNVLWRRTLPHTATQIVESNKELVIVEAMDKSFGVTWVAGSDGSSLRTVNVPMPSRICHLSILDSSFALLVEFVAPNLSRLYLVALAPSGTRPLMIDTVVGSLSLLQQPHFENGTWTGVCDVFDNTYSTRPPRKVARISFRNERGSLRVMPVSQLSDRARDQCMSRFYYDGCLFWGENGSSANSMQLRKFVLSERGVTDSVICGSYPYCTLVKAVGERSVLLVLDDKMAVVKRQIPLW